MQIIINILGDSYTSFATNSFVWNIVIIYTIVYDVVSPKVLSFPRGFSTFYVNFVIVIIKIIPCGMYVRFSFFIYGRDVNILFTISQEIPNFIFCHRTAKFWFACINYFHSTLFYRFKYKKIAFAYYILFICSHAYAMHQRKVLNDDEWTRWLQWMRNWFKYGTISEQWKQIQSETWFNPDFENFLNEEIMPKPGSRPTDF